MRVNKTGIISVVCGVAGLALCWNKICVPFILLAFVFGIISLTDYLGYKIPAICGMAFAVLATTIVFVKYILPIIQLAQISENITEPPIVTQQVEVAPTPTPHATKEEDTNEKPIEYLWETDEWKVNVVGVAETNPTKYDKPSEIVYVVKLKIENKGYEDADGRGLYIRPEYIIDSQGQMGWESSLDVQYYNSELPIGTYTFAEYAFCVAHKGDFQLGFVKTDSKHNELTYTFDIELK